MFYPTLSAKVCFISCHGGPADHFAAFAEHLSKNEKNFHIYASGPALKKFEERGVAVSNPFSIEKISSDEEDALAEQIAKACFIASVVITDVGHPFDIKVQKAFAKHAANVLRLAYYDNPEPYVPGGYSAVAAEVMAAAQRILFANSNLVETQIFREPGKEIDFANKEKIGVGYYPINQVEKIILRRTNEKAAKRAELLLKHDMIEKEQKLFSYFGGNNDEYFAKAFPAFLSFITEGMVQIDFSNLVIVIQQHPGAKAKNQDGNLVLEWIRKHGETANAPKFIISDFSSEDAQVIADGALYFQTSMGPQFVLAGIPTIQIGHETYQDILIRNKLSPSVTSPIHFIKVIKDLEDHKKEVQRDVILDGLGIKADWLKILKDQTE